jgi:hypothetical protein
MWEPQRLTTQWASTACYSDSFLCDFIKIIPIQTITFLSGFENDRCSLKIIYKFKNIIILSASFLKRKHLECMGFEILVAVNIKITFFFFSDTM